MKFAFLRKVKQEAELLGISPESLARQIAHIALAQILTDKFAESQSSVYVKGGTSVGWRVEPLTYRETKDFDLVAKLEREDIKTKLESLAGASWGIFVVGNVRVMSDKTQSEANPESRIVDVRVPLRIANSEWLTVRLEVLPSNDSAETELLPLNDYRLLFDKFSLPNPKAVSVIGIELQIAEKLYALTAPNSDRSSDLCDVCRLSELESFEISALKTEIRNVFARRGKHVWDPSFVPGEPIRSGYDAKFVPSLDEATSKLATLLMQIGELT